VSEALEPPVTVFIGVGANIDPETNILAALEALSGTVRITGVSTFYRTEAIGRPSQPAYLNGVVRAETERPPRALKFEVLREIEAALGRVRTEDRYAARPIDLDVLIYGDAVLDEPGLELPDPEVRERPFLAAGIEEIAPGLRWPGTSERIGDWAGPGTLHRMTPAAAFSRRVKETFAP